MNQAASTTKNTPHLRFSEFSGEWEKVKFFDLIEKVLDFRGRTPVKLGMQWGGEIPSLSALNVKMGYIDLSLDPHKGSHELYRKWMVHGDLQKNDILFTMEAPLGNVVLVPDNKKYILSQRVIALKTKTAVSNPFLYQLMCSDEFQNRIENLSTGSTAKGINQKSLQKVTLFKPLFDEQKKIADTLEVIDRKIKFMDGKLTLLKKYKKGTMQKIFSQKIRFKDRNGIAYKKWAEKTLGDVFTRLTKKNEEDNKNVLTISAQEGLINQKDYFNKSVSAANLTGYYILLKDDFAYNKSYSKGYPMGAIKKLNYYNKGVVSTLYICFRTKEDNSPEFFEQYFNMGLQNKAIEKIAQEGARNHGLLNISVVDFFENILLTIPSVDEQQKIAEFLTAIDDRIQLEERRLAEAKKFKKSLLQQMFV